MASLQNFLDLTGLSTTINQLKLKYATKKDADNLINTTDPYILNIDYTRLEFDTSKIINADSINGDNE